MQKSNVETKQLSFSSSDTDTTWRLCQFDLANLRKKTEKTYCHRIQWAKKKITKILSSKYTGGERMEGRAAMYKTLTRAPMHKTLTTPAKKCCVSDALRINLHAHSRGIVKGVI